MMGLQLTARDVAALEADVGTYEVDRATANGGRYAIGEYLIASRY